MKLIYSITLGLVIVSLFYFLSKTTNTFEFKQQENIVHKIVSWYGKESCVKKSCLMANGVKFNENSITCASRTFYGKTLTIKYNGKQIICPVTDKIAKHLDDKRIDLSKEAFRQLGELNKGLLEVSVVY